VSQGCLALPCWGVVVRAACTEKRKRGQQLKEISCDISSDDIVCIGIIFYCEVIDFYKQYRYFSFLFLHNRVLPFDFIMDESLSLETKVQEKLNSPSLFTSDERLI